MSLQPISSTTFVEVLLRLGFVRIMQTPLQTTLQRESHRVVVNQARILEAMQLGLLLDVAGVSPRDFCDAASVFRSGTYQRVDIGSKPTIEERLRKIADGGTGDGDEKRRRPRLFARALQGAESVHRVITPVGVEGEAPLPDCGPFRRCPPKSQASVDVAVDVEQVIRQRAGDWFRKVVGIEDFPVRIARVERGQLVRRRRAGRPTVHAALGSAPRPRLTPRRSRARSRPRDGGVRRHLGRPGPRPASIQEEPIVFEEDEPLVFHLLWDEPTGDAGVQRAIAERPEGHLPVGASLLVRTGHARIAYMVVAPTMLMPEPVSVDHAYRAFRAVLRLVTRYPELLHTVYCPGLCTGVGAVAPSPAAEAMAAAFRDWKTSRP